MTEIQKMLEEMKIQRDVELEGLTGDDKLFAKIKWDLKINDAWVEARKKQNARTQESVEEEYLGEKVWIFGTRRKAHAKRILRKDDEGQLFVKTDGGKAIVEWCPVVNGLKVKHWEY
ncbi:hypothetical protein [Bacillus phage PK2]|nr:hypothetical protein [Bacillus phage PK2]